MDIRAAVEHLKLTLPDPAPPKGNYKPLIHTGKWLVLSGQLPLQADGSLLHPGIVGDAVTVEQAQEAARLACLNGLAWIQKEQERAKANWAFRPIKLQGFVASGPTFTEHPSVINGASDLLAKLFGDMSVPTRIAVGCSSLPLGACVELDMTFIILS